MGLRTATLKPRWWEWSVLGVLLLLTPSFGALVVRRSAYSPARHTDFDVYARAGWAIRTDRDIYEVTKFNGLHYCYPPPFAVLMAPLAEPPAEFDSTGYLPFAVSVAVWYAISVGVMFVGVHRLASALERCAERPTPFGCRLWWGRRVAPIIFTLPAVGNTLSHGQVNLLLLGLLCAMLAAAMERRSIWAGLWLGSAVALKVIPAFLALVPLKLLDRRWLSGTLVAAVAWLFLLPAAVMGPTAALQSNRKFVDCMVRPALGSAESSARSEEMFQILRTDNQSIQAVLHAWQHVGEAHPPAEASRRVRMIHWLLGGLLTLIAFVAVSGQDLHGHQLLIFGGVLIAIMLLVSPMCHLHYYCLTLPLILGLMEHEWSRRDGMWAGGRLAAMVALHVVGNAFPLIFEQYRNYGFAPLSTLPLLGEGIYVLGRRKEIRWLQPIALQRAAA